MSYKNKKVYAFIDSQNLNMGIKASGWNLDFLKFRTFLSHKYNVKMAFLFLGYIKRNESLYKYLRKAGYTLIFKPSIRYKKDGYWKVKGNVDIELAIKVMLEFENFDKAVLVSGDGDFYTLIKHLKENGKLLRILTPNSKYSSLLKEFSDQITDVSLMKNKLKKSGRHFRETKLFDSPPMVIT